jgi:hypothetical protein
MFEKPHDKENWQGVKIIDTITARAILNLRSRAASFFSASATTHDRRD